ncbi:uncharacterized protein LOC135702902 [Ochlerotatus camptorhynchus]|uniref:uncharacterized protein LOC135702902 n=1 Tax=Ochlerotatus camptorhynchus TaxID=644619 RepID=UPI0031D55DDE
MDLPGISETSSSESIARLLSAHREAMQKVARKCLPYRDLDEFSTKLQKNSDHAASELSISSGSCVTFYPHKIYTIEEVTEDSRISVRKGERITSSAEELKERIERLKRISTTARNSKRPESRRGSIPRPPSAEIAARVNYEQEIAQKFEIMDRFLKDQMEQKQDSIDSEVLILRHYSRSNSTPVKNRAIWGLCCSCISGE